MSQDSAATERKPITPASTKRTSPRPPRARGGPRLVEAGDTLARPGPKGAEADLVRIEGREGNCHEDCWKVARARTAIHRFLDRRLSHDGNRFYEAKHGTRSPLRD